MWTHTDAVVASLVGIFIVLPFLAFLFVFWYHPRVEKMPPTSRFRQWWESNVAKTLDPDDPNF
jgi:hypothetical protein